MTNERDCPHGRLVGKCADCDVIELEKENEALRADAERWRWLRDNAGMWSWNPDGRAYPDKVVGFACRSTGYLDFDFQAAIDAARSRT